MTEIDGLALQELRESVEEAIDGLVAPLEIDDRDADAEIAALQKWVAELEAESDRLRRREATLFEMVKRCERDAQRALREQPRHDRIYAIGPGDGDKCQFRVACEAIQRRAAGIAQPDAVWIDAGVIASSPAEGFATITDRIAVPREAGKIAASVLQGALERHRNGIAMEDDWEFLTGHGLLAPTFVTEPCREEGECGCLDVISNADARHGWECWRPTDLARAILALAYQPDAGEGVEG